MGTGRRLGGMTQGAGSLPNRGGSLIPVRGRHGSPAPIVMADGGIAPTKGIRTANGGQLLGREGGAVVSDSTDEIDRPVDVIGTAEYMTGCTVHQSGADGVVVEIEVGQMPLGGGDPVVAVSARSDWGSPVMIHLGRAALTVVVAAADATGEGAGIVREIVGDPHKLDAVDMAGGRGCSDNGV